MSSIEHNGTGVFQTVLGDNSPKQSDGLRTVTKEDRIDITPHVHEINFMKHRINVCWIVNALPVGYIQLVGEVKLSI